MFTILSLWILLFIFHRYIRKNLQAFTYPLLGLLFFFLGLLYAEMRVSTPDDPAHIYNLVHTQQTVCIDGILLKYPSVVNTSSGPETRLLIKVKTVYQPAAPDQQMIKGTGASGLVLFTLKGLLPENLQPGNRFLVRAKVSRPVTYSTPGSFNYKQYLANQSIFLKGWIQSSDHIMKLQTAGLSQLTSMIRGLKYLPERIRYQIAVFLDRNLTQPARGLYKAILIGDRRDVPAASLENFTGAGCIHILAISGMHMGLLALVTVGILTWVLKRSTWLLLHVSVQKIAGAVALLPMILYALVAGFNIPVLRALLMIGIVILAIFFDRPGNLINRILLAALLMLIWKPEAIFTASFQLSFSAVIAIALVYPLLFTFLFHEKHAISSPFARRRHDTKSFPDFSTRDICIPFYKWFLAGTALTTAALIGTFPLLLFHFNRLSLVAPFSNLIVEPLVCLWSLIIGLAAAICIPLMPVMAKILFTAGSYGLIAADRICAFFTALPYSSLWLPTPTPLEIILVYLFLLSSVIALHQAGKQRRYSLVFALFMICLLVSVSAVTTIAKQPSRSTSVTFLDVGHGASILLQLPGNTNILIDGGGAESDRFNIGARVIGPFLWNRRLRRLDAVIVTHPHADHYNGLPFVLDRFHPKELWINGTVTPDKKYRELLDLAAGLNIEIKTAADEDILYQNGNTRLACIHSGMESASPDEEFVLNGSDNANDLSLVLRLEAGNKSFLFPADITAELAEKLGRAGKNLKADVLMAPHHGSPSSISRDFIGYVTPTYIAISAGRNNRFNFPARSFYELQQKGIEILSTGRDGTITFSLENDELTVSRYQVN